MNVCVRDDIDSASDNATEAVRRVRSAGAPRLPDVEATAGSANKILVLGDDPEVRVGCERATHLDGVEVFATSSVESAQAILDCNFPGIVVTDMRLADMDGLQFLEFVQGLDADLPVIMLAEPRDMPLAMEAIGGGAYDFIEKPFSPAHLFSVVRQALEKRRLTFEVEHLRRLQQACPSLPAGLTLSETVENFERELIASELERQAGNVARSSKALRIARTTLHDKMRKYGLD